MGSMVADLQLFPEWRLSAGVDISDLTVSTLEYRQNMALSQMQQLRTFTHGIPYFRERPSGAVPQHHTKVRSAANLNGLSILTIL